MLTLTFNKSRSPKISQVLKRVKVFERVDIEQAVIISLSVKEIFEKWDDFNSTFWTVVDWKGSTLSYDGMTYHSHTDKTRIFYALQNSRWKWMGIVENRLMKIDKVYAGEIDPESISVKSMTEEEINDLLDKINAGKSNN